MSPHRQSARPLRSSFRPFGRPSLGRGTLLLVALVVVAVAAHQVYRRAPGPGALVETHQTGVPGGVIRLD